MTTGKTHIQPAPVELWRHGDPTSTEMWRFLSHINATYNLSLNDYPGLYKWSVDNVADFWKECWEFVGIKAPQPFSEVRSSAPCHWHSHNSGVNRRFLIGLHSDLQCTS